MTTPVATTPAATTSAATTPAATTPAATTPVATRPAATTPAATAGAAALAPPVVTEMPNPFFTLSDSDVTPPVVVDQPLPRWSSATNLPERALRGTLELVIDEKGGVESVTLVEPVWPPYRCGAAFPGEEMALRARAQTGQAGEVQACPGHKSRSADAAAALTTPRPVARHVPRSHDRRRPRSLSDRQNAGHFLSRSETVGEPIGQSIDIAGSFHMTPDSCAGAYSVVVL